MPTERLIKWSKESKEFFEKAEDNSVVLDLVISFGCASQTGEGFEELVNTINSESIKRKVKKVIITDTSYLYRHVIPEFSKYADPTIETDWYLKNKKAIEKLKVDTELKSWADGINTETFKKWYQKIMIDFAGDEKGNGINLEFRNEVKREASSYIYKKGTILKHNLDFILEECAYACAFLDNVIMAYPGNPTISVEMSMQTNNTKFFHLDYKISETSSKINKISNRNSLDLEIIDKEISIFMREKVSNVNFFVVDKKGDTIYINNALDKSIGYAPTKALANEAWKNSSSVIKQEKQLSFEEVYKDKTFLSVKSPLEINGKVEGVIGLSVDITDRKKKEELENKLKMEKELYKLAREVAHDICSPLSALEMVKYMSLDKLGEQERKMFELSIRRIKDITNKLIERYKGSNEKEKEEYIMPSSIKEVIESMRYRYQDREIKFKYNEEDREKFAFIKGERSEFSRMMTNVIKNGVEAIEGKEGEIEVSEIVREEEVEIRVKDNGKGMKREMAEKIKKGEGVGTTKKGGHGIGTQQIIKTVKAMKGNIEIETKEGEGTEFIVTFPKAERPRWFEDKIEIKKGEEVVVLDDELLVHEVWKEKLKGYEKEIRLKFFTQGVEALKYINSLERKEKVFLIADYELRKQEITGINVIEKSGMKGRHIMVTNAYLGDIRDFEEKSEYIKLFPKMYIDDIKLKVV